MILSIITPCTRIYNLPSIYNSILKVNNDNIEWIVIYDSDNIDYRILQYEDRIKIKLLNVKSEIGDSKGMRQRNLGIENSLGDYLYYLDDDNLIFPNLIENLKNFWNKDKIIIVNQLSNNYRKRFNSFDLSMIQPKVIDTAQILIPKKYNSVKWSNEFKLYNEYPYIRDILKLSNNDYVWVENGYSFYNYLRWYNI